MKKALLIFGFILAFYSVALCQGPPPITLTEVDGSPRKTSPTTIKVSNGTLTCVGSICTINTGGGSTTPGGSDTQLQRNNAGVFGGISGATSDGTNVTFGSANLRATSPRITSGILDGNGNGFFNFSASGSAVNGFSFTNAATGGSPTIGSVGSDTNIPLIVSPQGSGRLESTGPLRLSGTGSDTFTTPASVSVPTKINIPIYDPGNFGQIAAMGIGNIGSSRRVLSLFDARSGAHQPTLIVFTPDEQNGWGPSWEGSNSELTLKTTVTNGVIRFNDGSGPSQVLITPAATGAGAAFLHVKSSVDAGVPFQADGTATQTADLARFAVNGTKVAAVTAAGMFQSVGLTFSNLGTPADGNIVFCSDCQVTSTLDNTCTSGGSGAFAFRINSAWRCFALQN